MNEETKNNFPTIKYSKILKVKKISINPMLDLFLNMYSKLQKLIPSKNPK